MIGVGSGSAYLAYILTYDVLFLGVFCIGERKVRYVAIVLLLIAQIASFSVFIETGVSNQYQRDMLKEIYKCVQIEVPKDELLEQLRFCIISMDDVSPLMYYSFVKGRMETTYRKYHPILQLQNQWSKSIQQKEPIDDN